MGRNYFYFNRNFSKTKKKKKKSTKFTAKVTQVKHCAKGIRCWQ